MARVLVVDDDADILNIVEKVLSTNDHIVFTATDAVRAMDLLNSSLFDLLISDANMPGFSGFDLIRTIRNNKKFEKMAVAMLTGLREKKDIDKAIRIGVDDYIIKPINPSMLLKKIEILFEKHPPMDRAEYVFPDSAKFTSGKCQLTVKVTKISELGLSFRSHVEISDGMTLELTTDIFKKIGMAAPPMRVIACKKLMEFEYEIRVAFLGLSEGVASQIRSWIHAQPARKKAG